MVFFMSDIYQRDNVLGSVCPFVCPSVTTLLADCLCVCNQSNFWHAAVDIRGSALPSAAKSNESYYQSEVFVFVSVIRGHILIIAHMRSIGVLICESIGAQLVIGV